MISKLGFEVFTFKKLSVEVELMQTSFYRYFESIPVFLTYLMTCFWRWLEYGIDFHSNHFFDPKMNLEPLLIIFSSKKEKNPVFLEVNESAPQKIVISESDRVHLTKQMDQNNREGLSKGNRALCKKRVPIVQEVNSEYPYPSAVTSTLLEASNQQIFFSENLPYLTGSRQIKDRFDGNFEFLKSFVFNSIMAKNG